MNLRNATLLTNVVLLVVTFTSLLWNFDPGLFLTGLGIGVIVSLPSVIALIDSNRIGQKLLLRLNLGILLLLALVTLAMLYNQLLDTSGKPVVALVVVLFLALALCASLQLFILSVDQQREALNVDDLLQSVFGGPSIILMLAIATIVTGMLQSLTFALSDSGALFHALQSKLLHRGVIPYMCLMLFFWGLLLLTGNYILLQTEIKRVAGHLGVSGASETSGKNLTESDSAICQSLDMLFRESKAGNTKAKKLACVEQLSEYIWNKSEHLYSLPRYINWAIPILGFIGTVLGISLAAESIGGLISSPETNFSSAIGDAIAPLGIAFDTTLVALSLSVVLMLIQTLSQRWQERQLQQFEQKIRDTL